MTGSGSQGVSCDADVLLPKGERVAMQDDAEKEIYELFCVATNCISFFFFVSRGPAVVSNFLTVILRGRLEQLGFDGWSVVSGSGGLINLVVVPDRALLDAYEIYC